VFLNLKTYSGSTGTRTASYKRITLGSRPLEMLHAKSKIMQFGRQSTTYPC